MTGGGEFSNAEHLRMLGEERRDRHKDWEVANETKLKGLVRYLKCTNMRLILQANITGAWMSVRGTTVSGKLLSATEFWDFLCACYNISPLNLQSQSDGCGTVFRVTHALRCSTGGLLITHNKNSMTESSIYPDMTLPRNMYASNP